MGKLRDSLISGSSGRIGRIIVSNVFGTEIIKIRPKKSTKMPTAKQNLIKERFNKSVVFLSSYKEFAKEHYNERKGLVSRYNWALANVLNALYCDMDTLQIIPHYEKIMFSKGKGLRPIPVSITSNTPLTIQINWNNNARPGSTAELDNLLVLIASDEDLDDETIFYETTAVRQDQTVELEILPRYQYKTMQVWIAFFNEDLNLASDSSYIGPILVT